MTVNLSKALLTLSATVLLTTASAIPSDARPHVKRLSPTQSENVYERTDSETKRDWDGSCFRSTGLPAMYACSANGG
jgi:hypothetical protein